MSEADGTAALGLCSEPRLARLFTGLTILAEGLVPSEFLLQQQNVYKQLILLITHVLCDLFMTLVCFIGDMLSTHPFTASREETLPLSAPICQSVLVGTFGKTMTSLDEKKKLKSIIKRKFNITLLRQISVTQRE